MTAKIALVAPYAEPEKGACPLRVKSLQSFLQKKGHHVTVFAPQRGTNKSVPGIMRYSNARSLMSHIFDGKFDVVWGTSPPMTHSFLAGIAAKLSGAIFIADVRDPWSYVASHSEEYRTSPFKQILFSLIDAASYYMADQIWVVTEGIAKIITQNNPPLSKKVHIIPNGTTPSLFYFSAVKRTAIRKKFGLKTNDVLALYGGGFVGWDVDKMLVAISPVLQKENLFLLLAIPLQDSTELTHLRAIVQNHQLEKKVFFIDEKDVPFESYSDYLSAADVGLATVPDPLFYCVRVKAYDYAAGGLSVAARGPAKGSLREVMERTKIGTYATSGEELAKQLTYFVNHYSFSKKERARIAAVAASEFDRDISNAKAEALLRKLLS